MKFIRFETPLSLLTREQPDPAPTPRREPERDDYGRSIARPALPGIGSIFQPRVRDRLHAIQPPWSPEQIAIALRQAEQGDLSAQSDLFEHMEERDGALAGFMQSRRLAPCGLKWSIEAANDSAEAERVAEMVRAEIKGIPNFPHAFRDSADAIGKGMAALWVDWQPGGRTPHTRFRIDGIHHINPKRYRFHWQEEKFLILPDDAPLTVGVAEYAQLRNSGIGVEPPAWKVMLHRTRIRSGHPAKAGVLRICAFYFLLRNYSLKDLAVFCDVYGMPLRLGKYTEGASDEDKAALADALQHLGTDAAAIIDKRTEIEYLESAKGGRGTLPHPELDRICERNMELAILGQEQTNTIKGSGNRAQTEAGGAKVRQDLLEADCIDEEATWTWQLCYPIVGFSALERPTVEDGRVRWPVADQLCPKFKLHYEPEQDYESMILVDVPLHTVLKLPTTLGQLAKRYNRELPDGVDANTVVEFEEPEAEEGEDRDRRRPENRSRDDRRRLSLATGSAAQDALDELADRGVRRAADAIGVMAEPIRALAANSATLEEFEERLRKAYDDLDADDLEAIVRRSLFVTRLYGRHAAVRKVK